MKLQLSLSIIVAIILLTTSISYLNQYKSFDDNQNEDQLQAYENKIKYDKETGAIQWDLSKNDLDPYQMQAIQKTMSRGIIQKHIKSDFITKLEIDASTAKNVQSIKPILEGISTGFDQNLKHLNIKFDDIKIDIDIDFEDWKLPQQIQVFELSINTTATKSMRNILKSMNSFYSRLNNLKLSAYNLSSDIKFDQSFVGITLPQLSTFHFVVGHDKEQENFDNLARVLSHMNLIDLKLSFEFSKFKQVNTSLQILSNSQSYLRSLDINFDYNKLNSKSEFTQSLMQLFQGNNLKKLNLNVSGNNIDEEFLSSFEDYLYDKSQSEIEVNLDISYCNTKRSKAVEIFKDISQIMGQNLKIFYPYEMFK